MTWAHRKYENTVACGTGSTTVLARMNHISDTEQRSEQCMDVVQSTLGNLQIDRVIHKAMLRGLL